MRQILRDSAVAIAAAVLIAIGTAGPAIGASDVPPSPGASPTAEPLPEASPHPGTPITEDPPTEEPPTDPPSTEVPATDGPSATEPAVPPSEPAQEQTEAPQISSAAPEETSQFVVPLATSTIAPFGPGVHRLAGTDRFETSVAISQRFSPNVPVLYVATGLDFPDALTAAAAAAHLGGPLLLTRDDMLPDVVRAEITRLMPERIVVAGGEAAIGADVFSELAAMTPSIRRVGGFDRYETGELLVLDAFGSAGEAFVATGRDFPDALAASAAAGSLGAPVLLVDGALPSVRPATILTLDALGVRAVRIAGGVLAVNPSIEQLLKSDGFSIIRHQGADRYLTAAAINASVFSPGSSSTAFIATGGQFADGLAGASLAGGLKAPLYISRTECTPRPVLMAIADLNPSARVILGGTSAVSEAVAQGVECEYWVKPASGRITDVFGPRDPICTPGGCTQSFHRGVDIGTGCGAPIYAASDGRVSSAGPLGTYGNFVKIAHGGGIDTGYAHIRDGGILVGYGQIVGAGQQIAWSGATGAATGCHLHFEVYQNGTQIDPIPFMAAQGVILG